MAKLTMVQAINLALGQEMERDRSVLVLGEDVGQDGGVFRVTDGLLQLFSHEAPAARELRNRGLGLVNRLTPIKRWLTAGALDS